MTAPKPAGRLGLAQKAVRPALKGRMMISGPAGSGKTRSGLIAATALAEGKPVLGIDTEKESMLTYADDFDFVHLPWHPPFNVEEFVDTIRQAGDQFAVILIDSVSHFWRGDGGVLDIAQGKFTGWKEARPLQESLVEAILRSPAHVILCARAKMDHVQEEVDGRKQVRKLGMAVQQSDDLEYELNVAVEMSMDHTATVTKSRTTSLPVNRQYKAHQIGDMAHTYGQWLAAGEPPAPKNVAESLLARMNALPADLKKQCKAEFLASFGRPEQLRESAVAAAQEMVARYEPDPRPEEKTEAASPKDEATPAASADGGPVPTGPTTSAGAERPVDPETGEIGEQRTLVTVPDDEDYERPFGND